MSGSPPENRIQELHSLPDHPAWPLLLLWIVHLDILCLLIESSNGCISNYNVVLHSILQLVFCLERIVIDVMVVFWILYHIVMHRMVLRYHNTTLIFQSCFCISCTVPMCF